MTSYGQFCPVAKAAEIIATRWTPLILREMILGSSHFNDIHRGVPLMSRTLLSARLKDLERLGVIKRVLSKSRNAKEYRLTRMGDELKPIVIALGAWGQKWVESAYESDDWDAGVLMWDIRRRINVQTIRTQKTVIQFDFDDAPKEMKRWWIVVENGEVDLCQRDPGFDVDLYVTSDVRTLSRVWIGQRRLSKEIVADRIYLSGDKRLIGSIAKWFSLAKINEVAKETRTLLSSMPVT